MGGGKGRQCFLVKINLPPFYSLLLLLFVHAFLSHAPPFFHLLNTSLPLSFSLFLAPNPIDCILLHSWGGGGPMDEKEKIQGDREIVLALVLCYIFKCVYLKLSAGKIEVSPGSYFRLSCRFRFVYKSHREGISLRYSLSFHHYITPGGNS